MFSTSDTIVAIATPPGRGGIGVVRLSGPDAQPIAQRLITHRRRARAAARDARRHDPRDAGRSACGRLDRSSATRVDQVVVTYFPAPASYTGDDVVELSAHGSPVVLQRDRRRPRSRAGARLAEPGEFTLRAFLNGRIDLMQAEAVADLIDAVDAAAGAGRVRSAARHADASDRRRSTRRCSI